MLCSCTEMKNRVSSANKKGVIDRQYNATFLIKTAVSNEKIVGERVFPCLILNPGLSTSSMRVLPTRKRIDPCRN